MTAGGVAVAVLLAVAAGPAAGARAGVARLSGAPLRGIDISAYQHIGVTINWGMLARDGIRFVAIKVSEGTYYTNPYYRSDARRAARAGLYILPYVFANPSRSGGAATARFAVRAAGYQHGPGTLPLAVDLENDPYRRSDCYQLRPARMIAWIAGFIARARQLTGKWPVIYTTDAWWRECTSFTGRFRPDPLWLAAWDTGRPPVPWPWSTWAFWQYSDHGFLPGIGLADLDYFQPVSGLSSLHPASRHRHAKSKHKHAKSRHRHAKSRHRHRPPKSKKHRPPKRHPKPEKRPHHKSNRRHHPPRKKHHTRRKEHHPRGKKHHKPKKRP